jgi:hypothetical protein
MPGPHGALRGLPISRNPYNPIPFECATILAHLFCHVKKFIRRLRTTFADPVFALVFLERCKCYESISRPTS